jgi:hypothetical protein
LIEATSMMTPTLDDLDESFDAAQDTWTRAFCSTWDALVHGTSDVVDLADWADALLRIPLIVTDDSGIVTGHSGDRDRCR